MRWLGRKVGSKGRRTSKERQKKGGEQMGGMKRDAGSHRKRGRLENVQSSHPHKMPHVSALIDYFCK